MDLVHMATYALFVGSVEYWIPQNQVAGFDELS